MYIYRMLHCDCTMDNIGFHLLNCICHSFLWEYDFMVVILLFKISKCSYKDPPAKMLALPLGPGVT